MTRLQKAWETRRAKYGESGGNINPSALTWLPAERKGRYVSLRKMHGPDLAKQIIRMEMADASAPHS